jgi:hypothetical protein
VAIVAAALASLGTVGAIGNGAWKWLKKVQDAAIARDEPILTSLAAIGPEIECNPAVTDNALVAALGRPGVRERAGVYPAPGAEAGAQVPRPRPEARRTSSVKAGRAPRPDRRTAGLDH